MEKPKNESIDNLRNEAVDGEKIKGGGPVVTDPVVMGTTPLSGPLHLPGEPEAAIDKIVPDPLPLDGSIPFNTSADAVHEDSGVTGEF